MFTGSDDVVQFLGGAFADDGANGWCRDEDLIDSDAAFAIGLFHEQLGDHAAQRSGQHGADLTLLVGWKNVDDTVDRFPRVVGVQGAENEQPRLRSRQGERDRF